MCDSHDNNRTKMNIPLPLQEKRTLIQSTSALKMLAGRMYHLGKDGSLRLCIEPMEKPHYLQSAHVTIGSIHMASNQT